MENLLTNFSVKTNLDLRISCLNIFKEKNVWFFYI